MSPPPGGSGILLVKALLRLRLVMSSYTHIQPHRNSPPPPRFERVETAFSDLLDTSSAFNHGIYYLLV